MDIGVAVSLRQPGQSVAGYVAWGLAAADVQVSTKEKTEANSLGTGKVRRTKNSEMDSRQNPEALQYFIA